MVKTVIYTFAYLMPEYEDTIKKVALFLILWVSVITITSLLNALNEIYESRPSFNGVSMAWHARERRQAHPALGAGGYDQH